MSLSSGAQGILDLLNENESYVNKIYGAESEAIFDFEQFLTDNLLSEDEINGIRAIFTLLANTVNSYNCTAVDIPNYEKNAIEQRVLSTVQHYIPTATLAYEEKYGVKMNPYIVIPNVKARSEKGRIYLYDNTLSTATGFNIVLDGDLNVSGDIINSSVVPSVRKINNKSLATDITLTAGDVGARPDTWMPTAADVGCVPSSRLVNGKPLSENITLNAADVGAVPTTRTINGQPLTQDITIESGGKRTCRFVVGTSTAGWTASDCDYLCDGTADDVEINAAIQALPSTGGEIVILDGTYNITATILINKANTTLSGTNNVTLTRGFAPPLSITQAAIITIIQQNIKVNKLIINGIKGSYSSSYNAAIISYDALYVEISYITCYDCGMGFMVFNTLTSTLSVYQNVIITKNKIYNCNIALSIQCGYSLISDNFIYDNTQGIVAAGLLNVIIKDNILYNNTHEHIVISKMSNSTISGNIIKIASSTSNQSVGIYVKGTDNTSTRENIISNNNIFNCSIGIKLENILYSLIENNKISIWALPSSDTTYTIYIPRISGTADDGRTNIYSEYNYVANNVLLKKDVVMEDGNLFNTIINNKFGQGFENANIIQSWEDSY